MRFKSVFVFFTLFLLLLATPIAAVAGTPPPGSISFAPGATPFLPPAVIPTMGGIGLLLMALVLGGIAVQKIRSQGSSLGSFLVAGLAIGALASAGGGVSLISHSEALVASDFTITNPEGETLDVNFREPNTYTNGSGVLMDVMAITLPDSCTPPAEAATCEVGDSLDDGAACELDCTFDDQPQ